MREATEINLAGINLSWNFVKWNHASENNLILNALTGVEFTPTEVSCEHFHQLQVSLTFI